MQQRLVRGIQYEDVAQAADALLHEGLRPTIERIRMRIGRGSPNTVSPMLEQWFSSLGGRLGALNGQGQCANIPEAVAQAAQVLWEKASAEAQAQSEMACAAERARLEREAELVQDARAQLEIREHAIDERVKTMEDALQLCSQQLEESNARWQANQRTLTAQSAEIAANRAALEEGREQISALQQRLDFAHNQAKEEHASLEERHRNSERRWLAEVDRARQEARKSALLVQESERRIGALQQEADVLKAVHHAKELEQALHISSLRHKLASVTYSAEQSGLLLKQAQLRLNSQREDIPFKPSTANRRILPVRRKLGKNRL